MQIDMHYYGVYAMARAAGINRNTAKIIATASQFVDDNAEKDNIQFRDGARLDSEATAHHALNHKNIDLEDQRKIWVPFHFLPGNEGRTYTERLVCRKDSEIAREMVQHMLTLAVNRSYAVPLMGIVAHVYADTFAHYGFSGISSRRNKIVSDSFEFDENITPKTKGYLQKKAKQFKENYPREGGLLTNIKAWFAETFSGALGHGAAVTFPDRPYLKWSFKYEDPEYNNGTRDNPATFLEGCKGLHALFRDFTKVKPECAEDSYTEFTDMENEIATILNLQAPKSERIAAWRRAAKNGNLLASGPENIPHYNANIWHNGRENLSRQRDSSKIKDLSIYRFYQAAAVYRTFVLRILLPSKGLIIT